MWADNFSSLVINLNIRLQHLEHQGFCLFIMWRDCPQAKTSSGRCQIFAQTLIKLQVQIASLACNFYNCIKVNICSVFFSFSLKLDIYIQGHEHTIHISSLSKQFSEEANSWSNKITIALYNKSLKFSN